MPLPGFLKKLGKKAGINTDKVEKQATDAVKQAGGGM